MRIELFTREHATYVGRFFDKKLAVVLFCFMHARVDEWQTKNTACGRPSKGYENQLQSPRCEYHFTERKCSFCEKFLPASRLSGNKYL